MADCSAQAGGMQQDFRDEFVLPRRFVVYFWKPTPGVKPLFLKSLELYGFKSFADKTRLEFSDGTTACSDRKRLRHEATSSMRSNGFWRKSTKTLRASKMETVNFNGTTHANR
jgi:hypothetical protein